MASTKQDAPHIDVGGWATVSLVKDRIRIELQKEGTDELLRALYSHKESLAGTVQGMETDAKLCEIMGGDPQPYRQELEKATALYKALLEFRYR